MCTGTGEVLRYISVRYIFVASPRTVLGAVQAGLSILHAAPINYFNDDNPAAARRKALDCLSGDTTAEAHSTS